MENNIACKVDPMGVAFAKAMEIFTYIGLAVMLIPGVIYLFDVRPFIDVHKVAAHWGEPSSQFWEHVNNMTIHGYSWFLSNLGYMDMLCIGGVAILSLVPLVSIFAALMKAKGTYRGLLFLLLLEFVFAIVKPLILGGAGE
ncbi:MAG: hypothetical protein K6360_07955 [Deltaproteobacteria bacterium]